MKRRTTSMIIVAMLIVACTASKDPEITADFVFTNASVYTLDDEQPWAEAVAIVGDTIVYVGAASGTDAFTGKATKRVDLAGRLMLPGFIDTHVHPVHGGAYAKALSLDTNGTVDGWVDAIAEYAAANPDQEILFGYGFLATTFGPVGPTRELIDAVVPDRPVLIMDEGFHAAWANSAALKRLNITQDTADPVPGYSYYKRNANGDATGYLLEGTARMAMDTLDVITADVIAEGTAIVIDIMNSYGVTSAFDAGTMVDIEIVDAALRQLSSQGDLSIRIVGSSRPETAAEAAEAVNVAAEWSDRIRGARYHYNTLKIPDDGTVEGRTAAMFEDYQGEPGNAGETVFSEVQMIEMIGGAASRNMDVHIHALGERAVHETLNAIEVSRLTHPDSDTRYTICHIQVVIDQDVPRFGELDVFAQSTPLWASYDTYGKQFVSDDQFSRFWRYKSIEDAGGRLTFGSDFPASGAGTLGLSPLMQIEIGHTRQMPGEPDAAIQPLKSERLSVESLVRGFTINAAHQLHMENDIGSVEVGKKADLVVLNRNIFEADPYSIHDAGIVLTMMNGDIVYEGSATHE